MRIGMIKEDYNMSNFNVDRERFKAIVDFYDEFDDEDRKAFRDELLKLEFIDHSKIQTYISITTLNNLLRFFDIDVRYRSEIKYYNATKKNTVFWTRWVV